ncbi:MAG: gliding motility-associated C-terminal domain-containing protein [Crocinitomicaceae bacterium]|nr:gliding motility-associated C-terminal domain-containing protein [Crocinitomicaceae bacterium]MBK8924888.1 gliding motility-associated C-terminal domain-containing protein [Crocinitomicaceae bacterium]
MNKRYFLLSVLCFFIGSTWSQLENHVWHFGNHTRGIQFNLTTNTPFITNTSYTPYVYGCGSSIVDPSNGDLLFYSDGQNVIDATHAVMPNGNGLNGAPATFSSGAACKIPGDCNSWYVFTITTQTEYWPTPVLGNLYYSVVDMNLVGNGMVGSPLGDVAPGQKNILLATDVSEGIEIIPKANSHDYYLLVGKNNSASLDVYEITSSGITFQANYPLGIPYTEFCRIRFSTANNKIGICSLAENEPVVVADFDPATGVCSAFTNVPGTPIGSSTSHFGGVLDVEFSADGSKLYISKFRGITPSNGGSLHQYDLNTPLVPVTLIHNVSTSSSINAKGIQRGPDGKIYWIAMAGSSSLSNVSVINDANLPGASCNFVLNALPIGVNVGSGWNLFPYTYHFSNTLPQIPDTLINFFCGYPSSFTIDPLAGFSDAEGDNLSYSITGMTGATCSISAGILTITPDPLYSGNPQIEIIYEDDFCYPLSDTLLITMTSSGGSGTLSMPDSLSECAGNPIVLDAGSGYPNYSWSTGESTQTITVNTTGWYSVSINTGGCILADSTYVVFGSPTPFSLGADQTLCADSLLLNPGAFVGTLTWSDGSIGLTNWITASGQYSAIGENAAGCLSYDTVNISLMPLPNIDLGADQQACEGDTIVLSAGFFPSILWNTGATTSSIDVTSSGNYSVTVTNSSGCQQNDNVDVFFNIPLQLNLGPDINICANEAVLSSSGYSGTVNWNTGEIGSAINVTNSGQYIANGIDLNGCFDADTIDVFLAPIPVIDLGDDTAACPGEFVLTANGFSNVLWSNGSNADTLVVLDAGTYSVEVTNNYGCQAFDQIQISFLNPMQISLGPDIETCMDNQVLLHTGVQAGQFHWSTNQYSPAINVTETGLYSVQQTLCGTTYTDSIQVTFSGLDQVIYIPNAFTPDGNLLNNEFEVVFGDYTHLVNYEIFIFNRWGQVLFHSHDPYEKWDGIYNGTLVQDGVYVYFIKLESDCFENPYITLRGHVTVLK